MPLNQLTDDLDIIQALSDLPNATDGLTAAQLKAKFDEASNIIKDYLNAQVIDKLNATTSGASGAHQIASASISGVSGSTVYAQLVALKAAIDAVVLGQIPDGSLTYAKLTDMAKEVLTSAGVLRQGIINGGFDVWQRGTSFSPTTNFAYTADRWFIARNGGSTSGMIISQVSGEGSRYAMRFGRNTGDINTNIYSLVQRIDIDNAVAYRGKKAVLSLYIRKGSGYSSSTSRARIFVQTTNSASPSISSSGVFSSGDLVDNYNEYVTLTTSYQRVEIEVTAALSSSLTQILIAIQAPDSSGTAPSSDYVQIERVQLEVGEAATPYEPRHIGLEYMLCQRYYTRSASALNNSAGSITFCCQPSNFSGRQTNVRFPVKMRTTPTVALYSRNSATSGLVENQTAGTNITAIVNDNSPEGFNGGFANSGDATALDAIRFHYTADAEL